MHVTAADGPTVVRVAPEAAPERAVGALLDGVLPPARVTRRVDGVSVITSDTELAPIIRNIILDLLERLCAYRTRSRRRLRRALRAIQAAARRDQQERETEGALRARQRRRLVRKEAHRAVRLPLRSFVDLLEPACVAS